MAILWGESFDYFGGVRANMLNGLWAEVDNAWSLSTERARTGTHSLKFTHVGVGSARYIARRVLGGAKTTLGVGFASFLTELPSTNNQFGIALRDNANATNMSVAIQSTGILAVKRGSMDGGGIDIESTDVPVIVANAWNHNEMKAVAGNGTAGAVEWRVNEVTVLNLTGVDTINGANVEYSQVGWGEFSPENASLNWYLDDLFTWDDQVIDLGDGLLNDIVDFVGDKKVFTRWVDADTGLADFQKSSGATGYPLISEATPDDAGYIFTANDGDESEFELSTLPGNTAEVIALIPIPRVHKTDAGTVTHAANIVTNGEVTEAPAIPATTEPTYWPFVFTKNPDTGVPFTPAEANASNVRLTRAVPAP